MIGIHIHCDYKVYFVVPTMKRFTHMRKVFVHVACVTDLTNNTSLLISVCIVYIHVYLVHV